MKEICQKIEERLKDYGFKKSSRGIWKRTFQEDVYSDRNELLVSAKVFENRTDFGIDLMIEENGKKKYVHARNIVILYNGIHFKNEYTVMETIRRYVEWAFDDWNEILKYARVFPEYIRNSPRSPKFFGGVYF